MAAWVCRQPEGQFWEAGAAPLAWQSPAPRVQAQPSPAVTPAGQGGWRGAHNLQPWGKHLLSPLLGATGSFPQLLVRQETVHGTFVRGSAARWKKREWDLFFALPMANHLFFFHKTFITR